MKTRKSSLRNCGNSIVAGWTTIGKACMPCTCPSFIGANSVNLWINFNVIPCNLIYAAHISSAQRSLAFFKNIFSLFLPLILAPPEQNNDNKSFEELFRWNQLMQHKRMQSVQVSWSQPDIRGTLLFEPHECNEIWIFVEWREKIQWKLEEAIWPHAASHTFLEHSEQLFTFFTHLVLSSLRRERGKTHNALSSVAALHFRPFSQAERCSHNQSISMENIKMVVCNKARSDFLQPTTDIVLCEESHLGCYIYYCASNRRQVNKFIDRMSSTFPSIFRPLGKWIFPFCTKCIHRIESFRFDEYKLNESHSERQR